MTHLVAGDPAPLFSLPDEQGNTISLRDLAGKKVLLYFYPKALTPGCTTQACALRDIKDELVALDTLIYGISPDPLNKLARFVEKKALNFPLLSDEQHAVADAFGVWGEKKFMGKTYHGIHRVTFLIDKQGIIEKIFAKFKTKDHHRVVLDYLKK